MNKRNSIVTIPKTPYILNINFFQSEYFKNPKKLKWAFKITNIKTKSIKQLNTLPKLSKHPSAIKLQKKKLWIPIATSTVYHQQHKISWNIMIPINKRTKEPWTKEPKSGQQKPLTLQQSHLTYRQIWKEIETDCKLFYLK